MRIKYLRGTLLSALIIASLLTPLLFFSSNPASADLTINLSPTHDMFVEAGANADTWMGVWGSGCIDSMYVGRDAAAQRAWLKFDLGSVPAGANITDAELFLYNWAVWDGAVNIRCHRIENDNWHENSITWNTQPAPLENITPPIPLGVSGTGYGWQSFVVTNFVASQHAGDKVASFCLIETAENTPPKHNAGWWTKEYSGTAYDPYLQITYTLPRAVSVSISPEENSGTASATLTYTVTVQNKGSENDAYDLASTNTAGWNSTLMPSTITLTSGASGNATLSITIPGGATPGAFTIATVAATSTADPLVTASDNCRATVSGSGQDDNVQWEGVYYNSRDNYYKSPVGSPYTYGATGEWVYPDDNVTFKIRIFENDVTEVSLRVWKSNVGQEQIFLMSKVTSDGTYEWWQAMVLGPGVETEYWYAFVIRDGSDTDYYGDHENRDGGVGMMYDNQPWPGRDYMLAYRTSQPPPLKTSDWVKNAIFYQIFPDRFRDGDPNNNAIGDGNSGDVMWENWGSSNQYPTLYAKRMNWGQPVESPSYGRDWFGGDIKGVQEKASYLADLGINAIYFNPIHDSTDTHGYTVIDYKSVNRYFGTHQRDPDNQLILDPEASIQAFENMMGALDNYGFRIVLDAVWNHCSAKHMWFDRDNDFPTEGAFESQTSPWYSWFTFNSWPYNYVCWWGFHNLPEINEVEGFKNYIYRDNENSVTKFWDNLGVDGWRLDCGPDVSHEFWGEFRTYYKQLNPEGYILGEMWGNASPWLQGDEWDSTMNYRFRGAVLSWANGGSVSGFDSALNSIKNDYSLEAFYAMFNILDSHDTERALTTFGENKSRMKLAVIFQMTYPGAPVVYYGDEVGMTGGGDPFCRQCYPWPDLGGSPDMNMFEHYRKLIGIRRSYSVLRTGSLRTLKADDENKVYVLARQDNSTNPVAVLIYNSGSSSKTVTLDVSDMLSDGEVLEDVLNSENYVVSGGKITAQVSGMWANILINKQVIENHLVDVLISPNHQSALPGMTLNYAVTISNISEKVENYILVVDDNSGWALTLSENMFENVQPGENRTTTLHVHIPENAVPSTEDNITVTATSMENAEVRDNDSCAAHAAVWTGSATFKLENLYKVNLYKDNLWFYSGNKLVVKFYNYDNVYENENIIHEDFTLPWQVVPENENVAHPGGIGVKKAKLWLVDNADNEVSKIKGWVTIRDDLWARLSGIRGKWPSSDPPTRDNLWKELLAMRSQWPGAPTTRDPGWVDP